ncbi:hypothetical protein ARMGADRAFT_1028234 [Armillaria gallica]|uniref:Uncharacterized protein n=1 Tax=Armillaria gallica TaxID=47427 RepID=A0A2H3E610_ARMGA|nr:hypothetical protein ARMGADRAFT_1028234 [Armillaria gallica]
MKPITSLILTSLPHIASNGCLVIIAHVCTDSSLRWEYTGSCTVEVANVVPFFSRAAMVNAHPFVVESKPVHNVLVCTVIVTEAFIAMASTLQFVNTAKLGMYLKFTDLNIIELSDLTVFSLMIAMTEPRIENV